MNILGAGFLVFFFGLGGGGGGSYWRDSLGDFRGGELPEIVTLK